MLRLAILPPVLIVSLLLLPGCGASDQAAASTAEQQAKLLKEQSKVLGVQTPAATSADALQPRSGAVAAPSDTTEAASSSDAAPAQVADGEEWVHADVPAAVPPSATPQEGRAPDFKVTTLDGRVVDSSILYGTKPVSITLWATWCPPCLAEIPAIQKLYNEHGKDVEFIAISLDDPKAVAAVAKMVKDRKMTYPVAHDTAMKVAGDFEANSIPLTVFVSASGALIDRLEGFAGEQHLIDSFEKAFVGGKSSKAHSDPPSGDKPV